MTANFPDVGKIKKALACAREINLHETVLFQLF
nr:MAG TPA: hypothetical protein [Caudoviricetes sp.]